MSDRHERLLAYLRSDAGWVTASELADHLGVTTRSVRSYVTAVKGLAAPLEVIESSTNGYRLDREAYASFLSAKPTSPGDTGSPSDRIYHLVRRLGDAPEGLDLYDLADGMFVSESTIESDLRKLRPEVESAGLRLLRRDNRVVLDGPEHRLRRLISRMFRDEGAQGFLEIDSIEREFASSDLRGFKTDLIAMLDGHGYFVNEYGINNVLLHVAIAVDRAAKRQLPSSAEIDARHESVAGVSTELDALIVARFGVALSPTDLSYLASLLTTRVITRGYTATQTDVASLAVDRELALVRSIVERVAEEYLVDLHNEEFIVRLSLHVSNLIARAHDQSYSRNPMTRSIKTAYPLIYEIAVFIASEIQRSEHIAINDDEISYIALHVGSYLERQSKREERVTCAIVCPNYYDMHTILRERLEAALGDQLHVEIVITRTDIDWHALATDIVVTTLPDVRTTDDTVVIQPFLTDDDVDAVRRAVRRVRRQRRRLRLKDDLLLFFDESLFVRNLEVDGRENIIRALGERMVALDIIDTDYVAHAIDRERMSSTAFTDSLAVPHAIGMTAQRTAICIAVNESPIEWGDNRVNVVALIAFSASDRTTFQSLFDQFVSVFAERDDVHRIIRGSADFPSFIEELVRSIDK
ncbi:BglG family transcription antiterminator [Marisediminicola sp. LYQ134]|uniref:BglG family transcription antiterminator n=1 Tax=Marisediminicola sp. LYQ134 TaxID=3391061 RepID=UPI0039832173